MARRQTLASLGATALEDKSPGLGAHSLAKAVGLGTTAIVGLKGSFHNFTLLDRYTVLKTKRLNNPTIACQGEGKFMFTVKGG